LKIIAASRGISVQDLLMAYVDEIIERGRS